MPEKRQIRRLCAFWRFWNTYLKNHPPCPGVAEVLAWACRGNHDRLYDKVKEDPRLPLEWAEECGIGFGLPEFDAA